jgi:sugar phosphate isomerase/epimerase
MPVTASQLGLQCYTIRDHCKTEEDFTASMAKAAEIGYTAVQISAVGPIPPETIKAICDANGIKILITHEPQEQIIDHPEAIIERLNAMDCKNTAFSGSAPDAAGYAKMAADMARVDPIYKAAGIQLSYHNHAHEFQRFEDGKTGMDILFDEPLVQFELDMYWVARGGASPEQWARKCKGRLPIVHVKDMAYSAEERSEEMAALGDGNLDLKTVFEESIAAGAECIMFEQDGNWINDDPWEAAQRTWDYVQAHIVTEAKL